DQKTEAHAPILSRLQLLAERGELPVEIRGVTGLLAPAVVALRPTRVARDGQAQVDAFGAGRLQLLDRIGRDALVTGVQEVEADLGAGRLEGEELEGAEEDRAILEHAAAHRRHE